ncbi:hypothetical protein SAMN04489806_2754 [Paramicrobacterium humi]|uniref:Uncharacterized protein n=1 Tax=Paramicrobacterium humi TaxID=640635 RepID=A0A1H4Q9L5_9MICO|nr:hypothetical protein [Microbacterium humi]SEC16324.1 hypothetical protein SAMN04489806_2754 [Microbacterium humi]
MSFAMILLAESEHVVNPTPMPTFMYGVLALIFFLFIGVATFTYRDVANRHSHKTGHQPTAHTYDHVGPEH